MKIGKTYGAKDDFVEPRYDHPKFQAAFKELNELLVREFDNNQLLEFVIERAEDRIDPAAYNRVLWEGLKGARAYPSPPKFATVQRMGTRSRGGAEKRKIHNEAVRQ